MSEEDPELIVSPLCQDVTRDGYTVCIEIYLAETNKWILEVVDRAGGSTVWDDLFKTDQLALEEFHHTLNSEGIRVFEVG